MATVKVKLRRPASEDGKGRICYRIIHKRQVRWIRTEFLLLPEEWDAEHECVKVPPDRSPDTGARLSSVREKIAFDLQVIREIVSSFGSRGECTAGEIAAEFRRRSEKTFRVLMQENIDLLKRLGKPGTAENYSTAMNSFAGFLGGVEISASCIDSELMQKYQAWLTARNVSKNTVSFYMRILRAVYNRAAEQGLTGQKHPFRRVYTGVGKTVKRAVSLAAMRRISRLDLSFDRTLCFARDMFMFSFYTRGMSFVDMAYLKKSDLKNGMLSYRRRKTGQRLFVKWEKCMQEIVSRYENLSRSGCADYGSFHDGVWLLPVLGRQDGDLRKRYKNAQMKINKALKTVAELAGVCAPLSMYAARHSWASIAKAKNIPLTVISEGMGHDSEATTRIYLASLDPSAIDRANHMVIKGI